MSKLLGEVIDVRKAKALSYEEYLGSGSLQLVDTVRVGHDADQPAAIRTQGQRALYNNLAKHVDLATRIDAKIKQVRPGAEWRGVHAREQGIKRRPTRS